MCVVVYSMTPRPSPLGLLFISTLVHLIQAQCVTSGYVLCLPAGSELGGIPQDDFVNSELWDSLQEATVTATNDGGILRRDLASRQDALCCAPTDKCLVVTDSNTPFCFVSTRKSTFIWTKRSSSDNPIRTFCANLQKKRTQTQRNMCSPMTVSVMSVTELTMPLTGPLSITRPDITRARMAQRGLSPQLLRLLLQAVQELAQRVAQPVKRRAPPRKDQRAKLLQQHHLLRLHSRL